MNQRWGRVRTRENKAVKEATWWQMTSAKGAQGFKRGLHKKEQRDEREQREKRKKEKKRDLDVQLRREKIY